MDYGIFNVLTDVNACGCTRGCTDIVRESAQKVDWEKNPLSHREIEPASATCRFDAPPTELHPHIWMFTTSFVVCASVCSGAGVVGVTGRGGGVKQWELRKWVIGVWLEPESLVGRAPDSWSKGCDFESRQKRRENFSFSELTFCADFYLASVPTPCYRSGT